MWSETKKVPFCDHFFSTSPSTETWTEPPACSDDARPSSKVVTLLDLQETFDRMEKCWIAKMYEPGNQLRWARFLALLRPWGAYPDTARSQTLDFSDLLKARRSGLGDEDRSLDSRLWRQDNVVASDGLEARECTGASRFLPCREMSSKLY